MTPGSSGRVRSRDEWCVQHGRTAGRCMDLGATCVIPNPKREPTEGRPLATGGLIPADSKMPLVGDTGYIVPGRVLSADTQPLDRCEDCGDDCEPCLCDDAERTP